MKCPECGEDHFKKDGILKVIHAIQPWKLVYDYMAMMLEIGQEMVRGERELFPVARLLGLKMMLLEAGRAIFQFAADERHHNPLGTLHGGIYCDLADAAMGYAYAATLGEGETFTTVELKINFFRPVRAGKLTAEARVVKAGNTLGYIECDVKDGKGKLVARAMNWPGESTPASGRPNAKGLMCAGTFSPSLLQCFAEELKQRLCGRIGG